MIISKRNIQSHSLIISNYFQLNQTSSDEKIGKANSNQAEHFLNSNLIPGLELQPIMKFKHHECTVRYRRSKILISFN